MNTERDADLLHAKLKSRAVISVETELQGLSVDYVGHKSSQPRPDKNRKKSKSVKSIILLIGLLVVKRFFYRLR